MDAFADLASDREDVARLGTRFLVYPQSRFIAGYERPEVIWISTPPGRIAAGPADHRMYVVDPALPKTPYEFPYQPPFAGDVRAPAEPGPDGHFDHLAVSSRQFLSAHSFACVHRVLDVFESYLGREIPWFFATTHERLEIVPFLEWDNAQSGYGFLELGEDDAGGEPFPFALNFDVIAHETGHLILFGTIGLPQYGAPTPDFLCYHEAAADFISLIGLLHFDSALDKILRRTRGCLMIANELDRLAELSDEKQIRKASNSLRIADVGLEVHDRSRPFTGALFDSLLEVFQLILVERGLASLDTRQVEEIRRGLSQAQIEHELALMRQDYEHRHFAMKSALEEARDIMGEILIGSWLRLSADGFTYRDAAEALVIAAEAGRARRFADRVYANFAWRGIL